MKNARGTRIATDARGFRIVGEELLRPRRGRRCAPLIRVLLNLINKPSFVNNPG